MKKIIIVVFVLVFSSNGFSQIQQGQKYENPNDLEQYSGIWVVAGKDSLSIKLMVKESYLDGPNIYYGLLQGLLIYHQKGPTEVEIINSGNILEFSDGIRYIRFSYEDPVTGTRGDALMIFEHDSDRVATWRLRPKEGVYPITEKSKRPPKTFSIPRDMVLRKVE